MSEGTELDQLEEYRGLLFSIAYRMVGEVGDAEDVVQETYIRAHRVLADGGEIREPKAFLSEVATRLAIDHLRSARVRRERYVGPWLPEPIVADEPTPEERAEELESLSMAFLVVLETLSPVERAVFLLHDIFGFDFDEVATTIEKSPANARQIAVRARKHIEARRPRFDPSPERKQELANRFFAAMADGDVDGLMTMLAEDAVMIGDGNGHGAVRQPTLGAVQIARFIAGIGRLAKRQGFAFSTATINGQPGAIGYLPGGAVASAISLEIAGGKVVAIHSVVNPEKLQHVSTPE
jgi:RNA polymerase sigma-70 factor (TIGR02957 family)